MQGNMWVESEVSNGSKFFFTITSQISPMSLEVVLSKMQPFQKRNILFVDTLFDCTGVVTRILELGLRPFVIHDVTEVSDKATCPHIDTIVVDSLNVVCFTSFVFPNHWPLLTFLSSRHCAHTRLFNAHTHTHTQKPDRKSQRIRASSVYSYCFAVTCRYRRVGNACGFLIDLSFQTA